MRPIVQQALNELQEIILQLDAEGDHVRRNQLVSIGRVFRDIAEPEPAPGLALTVQTRDNKSDRTPFYLFQDVAELFWPGDFDRGNHAAEDYVRERLGALGCGEVPYRPGHGPGNATPYGIVYFDSESGMFECHSDTRRAVQYVVDVIQGMVEVGV